MFQDGSIAFVQRKNKEMIKKIESTGSKSGIFTCPAIYMRLTYCEQAIPIFPAIYMRLTYCEQAIPIFLAHSLYRHRVCFAGYMQSKLHLRNDVFQILRPSYGSSLEKTPPVAIEAETRDHFMNTRLLSALTKQ